MARPDPPRTDRTAHGEERLDPLETAARAAARWQSHDGFADQTSARMHEIALRFARRLEALGIDDLAAVTSVEVAAFVDAPTRAGLAPSIGAQHFRRVTIRALYRTLRSAGHDVGDPTLDIALPPRGSWPARPLSTDEVVLCRTATSTAQAPNLRRAAAWALAESTAMTSELPHITPRDFDDPARPTAVHLPGTNRCDARTVTLTDWGATIIRRRIAELAHVRMPLVYDGLQPPGAVAPQASGCRHITSVLLACGLAGEPDVRPSSVRHWRARAVFDADGDLVAAARLLGARSLDQAATAIGHQWRDGR